MFRHGLEPSGTHLPELGHREHARQRRQHPVGVRRGRAHVVVQGHHIDALDIRYPARAQPGQDVALDHLAVLPLRIGLAVVGHVFVEKAPPQFGHGRRLGVPQVAPRQVLAGPGGGDDLGGPGPGGRRRDRPVRPDGDLHGPPAVAVLDDIGLASRRTDPDTEALYLVIPEDMLTVSGFEGVDGSFGDLGHGTLRFSLPDGNRMGTHRMQIGVYYSRQLSGRKDPNTM